MAQPPAAPLGEGPKTWRQRACESLRGYYIVDYTSLRKLIDPEWRAFLANNVKADPGMPYGGESVAPTYLIWCN